MWLGAMYARRLARRSIIWKFKLDYHHEVTGWDYAGPFFNVVALILCLLNLKEFITQHRYLLSSSKNNTLTRFWSWLDLVSITLNLGAGIGSLIDHGRNPIPIRVIEALPPHLSCSTRHCDVPQKSLLFAVDS